MTLPNIVELHERGEVRVGMKFNHHGYFCTITDVVNEGYSCALFTGDTGLLNMIDALECWGSLILSKESHKIINFRKKINEL